MKSNANIAVDCPHCGIHVSKPALFRHMLDMHRDVMVGIAKNAIVKCNPSISKSKRVPALRKEFALNTSAKASLTKVAKPVFRKEPSKSRTAAPNAKVHMVKMGTMGIVVDKPKISRNPRQLICILCGAKIGYGQMLEHKVKLHGEAITPRRDNFNPEPGLWVRVHQGGLPGLGKRKS